MRNHPRCPICNHLIDSRMISVRSFRCPHCRELLRETPRPTSAVGRYAIVGAITLGVLTGRISVIGWLLMLFVAYPLVVVLAHRLVILLFGYTLEPVSEAGHIPLGESGE
jgi:hypothetical protein